MHCEFVVMTKYIRPSGTFDYYFVTNQYWLCFQGFLNTGHHLVKIHKYMHTYIRW